LTYLVCSFEVWSQKRVANTVAAARVIASELADFAAAATGYLGVEILKAGAVPYVPGHPRATADG